MTFDLSAWAEPRRRQVDDEMLARFAQTWPPKLGEACLYPIRTGGKRIRPLLLFAAHESLIQSPEGADPASAGHALRAAAALELVHGYSLVHDDLPSMDDDDTRRGMPTAHVAYGEGAAILVGDAMLTEAFAALAELPPALGLALVGELARAAGHAGMIAGQAADVGLGGRVTDEAGLVRLHQLKTGALIRAAARMGGLAGGADPAQLDALTRYGEAIGLAFQLADDVLDQDQDAGEDGPPSFVKLLGAAETRRRAETLAAEAQTAVRGLPRPDALLALADYSVSRSV